MTTYGPRCSIASSSHVVGTFVYGTPFEPQVDFGSTNWYKDGNDIKSKDGQWICKNAASALAKPACNGKGMQICGQACVNIQNSANNCGSCGNKCPTGVPCRSGACRPCAGKKPGQACNSGTPGTRCFLVGGQLQCKLSPCAGKKVGQACVNSRQQKGTICMKNSSGNLVCVVSACAGRRVGSACKTSAGQAGKCTKFGGNVECVPNLCSRTAYKSSRCRPTRGQNCPTPIVWNVAAKAILKLRFSASRGHCSSIAVKICVDSTSNCFRSGYLGYRSNPRPASTPWYDFSTKIKGSTKTTHKVYVYGIGTPGGCNRGTLSSWGGTIRAITDCGKNLGIAGCAGKAPGTACNDNNPATKNDKCQNRNGYLVCTGSKCKDWQLIMTAGCSKLLTTGAYGKPGSSCWKYSDSQINSILGPDKQIWINFGRGRNMYLQLSDANGNPRPWALKSSASLAKWRWSQNAAWMGPCGHPSQNARYHWFFMKSKCPYGKTGCSCVSSNYENAIYGGSVSGPGGATGFTNRDSSGMFPLTGWSSRIKVYAKTACSQNLKCPGSGYELVATFGSRAVMSAGAVGNRGDPTFKLADADINKLLNAQSEMLLDFGGRPVYIKLTDPKGNPRRWSIRGYDTVKWAWKETGPWMGPCGHPAQNSRYRWFFFKTNCKYGAACQCASANYENAVWPNYGFKNQDNSGFFPITGWSSKISLYVKCTPSP
eukprot:TRINITY_DN2728_c0_g1_i1.p1 TRINITY_DN2728_c0_g1~~TRINITY_DN2728_c0_g1_i1.p1  ORF type:complete len:751 (-),score=79.53 TRINITY_DN2728_c0_g1_i1:121-2253(-)